MSKSWAFTNDRIIRPLPFFADMIAVIFLLVRAQRYCTLHGFGSINVSHVSESERFGFRSWNDTGCRSK
jgi:hypothetical protein